eukprot:13075334-Alexandrium_andersonii.AAC.1
MSRPREEQGSSEGMAFFLSHAHLRRSRCSGQHAPCSTALKRSQRARQATAGMSRSSLGCQPSGPGAL